MLFAGITLKDYDDFDYTSLYIFSAEQIGTKMIAGQSSLVQAQGITRCGLRFG